MDAKELLSTLIDLYSVKKASVADVMGLTPQALASRLNKKTSNNMTVNTLNQMLNAIRVVAGDSCAGYDIYVVPRTTKAPKGAYKITDGVPTANVEED